MGQVNSTNTSHVFSNHKNSINSSYSLANSQIKNSLGSSLKANINDTTSNKAQVLKGPIINNPPVLQNHNSTKKNTNQSKVNLNQSNTHLNNTWNFANKTAKNLSLSQTVGNTSSLKIYNKTSTFGSSIIPGNKTFVNGNKINNKTNLNNNNSSSINSKNSQINPQVNLKNLTRHDGDGTCKKLCP